MPKFLTRKWIKINDLSNEQYSIRSDLYDYDDAYIVIKERIIVTGTNNANRWNKKLILKNKASLISCISKINKFR